MAVRFLSLCVKDRIDLGRISSRVYNVRLFSTAAEQRSTGNDSHGYDDGDDQNPSVARLKMLEKRANKLEEQVQDLTERYKRAVAESDGVRRRTRKFVEDAKLFGIQSFCRDLVEVADMLERTTSGTEPKETTTTLTHSVEQIQDRLQEVFIKHGLEKMRPVGTVYDPYQHEVVCHTPAHGVEPGLIAVVKQDGYTLHGRTIRLAHVGIAVKTQDS